MQTYFERRTAMNCYSLSRQLVILLLLLLGSASPGLAQPAQQLPWDMARLSQAPQVEWIDQSSPIQSLFFTGEPYQGQPTRVFAYYASPRTLLQGASGGDASRQESTTQQKYPAIVLIHGGGGTAFREWAELWAQRGYAAIAMDLAGARPLEGVNAHRPENRSHLDDGGPGQGDEEKFGSVDKPPTEQWPYHAVASAVLAHSLICSFDEVDAERTAVTGISWGGYLTCIVAGVDARFKAAVPVYGCGFLYENSAWLPQFANMTAEQRQCWIEHWDPSSYLPLVTMPILFVNGTNDFAYPLDSYMKSFEAVPEPHSGHKQLCVTVNMPHGHPPGWAPQEIGLFVDQYLKGGRPLPQLGTPKLVKGQVVGPLPGKQPVASAELHYTVQSGEFNQRQWTTIAAVIDGEQIQAAAPPAETTAWFLSVKDDRGAVISSPIEFAELP